MFCTIVHEAADKLRSSCTSTLTCPRSVAVTTDVLATLFYSSQSLFDKLAVFPGHGGSVYVLYHSARGG